MGFTFLSHAIVGGLKFYVKVLIRGLQVTNVRSFAIKLYVFAATFAGNPLSGSPLAVLRSSRAAYVGMGDKPTVKRLKSVLYKLLANVC